MFIKRHVKSVSKGKKINEFHETSLLYYKFLKCVSESKQTLETSSLNENACDIGECLTRHQILSALFDTSSYIAVPARATLISALVLVPYLSLVISKLTIFIFLRLKTTKMKCSKLRCQQFPWHLAPA